MLSIIACLITFVSCSKADDATNQPTAEYYVHYVCSAYSTLSYKDENNQMVKWNETNKGLDVSIGPVEKGFEAVLTGQCGMNSSMHPEARIQISKNGSPWIDKGIQHISNGIVTLTYVIDF